MGSRATIFRIATATAALAVILGAFGAHALESRLNALETAAIWHTAVFYHLVHAVAVVALATRRGVPTGPLWCFLSGILCFSGSLYLLSFRLFAPILGPVTPLGGALLIAGWLWLCFRTAPFSRQS